MAKTAAQRAKKHGAKAVPARSASSLSASARSTHSPGNRAPGNQAVNGRGGTRNVPEKSNTSLLLLAALVITVALFAYLHLYALAQMTQLSSGLAMPDSRLLGFTPSQMESLRAAMNSDDRGQLSFIHKTAGVMFPLMFGLSWAVLIGSRITVRWWRVVLWTLTLCFVVVDLWQNVAIDEMLGARSLTDAQVVWTSALTQVRWLLLILCVLGVLAALVLLSVRKARTGRPELSHAQN